MKNAHSPPKAFPRACACVCIRVCVYVRVYMCVRAAAASPCGGGWTGRAGAGQGQVGAWPGRGRPGPGRGRGRRGRARPMLSGLGLGVSAVSVDPTARGPLAGCVQQVPSEAWVWTHCWVSGAQPPALAWSDVCAVCLRRFQKSGAWHCQPGRNPEERCVLGGDAIVRDNGLGAGNNRASHCRN